MFGKLKFEPKKTVAKLTLRLSAFNGTAWEDVSSYLTNQDLDLTPEVFLEGPVKDLLAVLVNHAEKSGIRERLR